METGEVCSAFSREEAAQWYEEAVNLSALLASNDFSLQLHSLLTRYVMLSIMQSSRVYLVFIRSIFGVYLARCL